MKKVNLKNKKGMATVLGLVLAVAIGSIMVGSFINKAADGNGYVTTDKLMEQVSDSDGEQVQKIFFGKNEDGSAQEWYLVGKDETVSGDNVVIVAANPIKKSQVFEDDGKRNKKDGALWADCTYENGAGVTEVHPNHYGASDLRAELKAMLNGNTYFSDVQKAMMNATTISAYDTRNRVEYTMTDKLYALSSVEDVLYAGSNDSIAIDMSNVEEYFWLRSTNEFMKNKGDALTAGGENTATSVSVDMSRGVLPATNLNLSSVLFASAAPTTGAGEINKSAAMTLRMDGNNQSIGTVTYDETSGTIFVKSNKADGAVSLIVLGSNQDWYYSKSVSGTEKVTTDMITASVENATDISLEECTIWIETTDATTQLTYAQMAVAGAVIDATGDGMFDVTDLVRYKKVVAGVEGAAFADGYDADWNGDGSVNDADVKLIRRYLVSDGATITEIIETENMDGIIASDEYKGMKIEGASTNYKVAVQGYVTEGKNIRLAVEVESKYSPETVLNPYPGMSQYLFAEFGFGDNTGNGDCTLVKANVLEESENASAVAKTTFDSTNASYPYKTVIEMWIPKDSITNNTNENFIPMTRMALFHELDAEDNNTNWLVAKWAQDLNPTFITADGLVLGLDGVISGSEYGGEVITSVAGDWNILGNENYYMTVRGQLLDDNRNMKIAVQIDSQSKPIEDNLHVKLGVGNTYPFTEYVTVYASGYAENANAVVRTIENAEGSAYVYTTIIEMYVSKDMIKEATATEGYVCIPWVYLGASGLTDGGNRLIDRQTDGAGPYGWKCLTTEGIMDTSKAEEENMLRKAAVDGVISTNEYGGSAVTSIAGDWNIIGTTDYYVTVQGKWVDNNKNIKVAIKVDSKNRLDDNFRVELGLGNNNAADFTTLVNAYASGTASNAIGKVGCVDNGAAATYRYTTTIELYIPNTSIQNDTNSDLVHIPRIYLYSGDNNFGRLIDRGGWHAGYAWSYIKADGLYN